MHTYLVYIREYPWGWRVIGDGQQRTFEGLVEVGFGGVQSIGDALLESLKGPQSLHHRVEK